MSTMQKRVTRNIAPYTPKDYCEICGSSNDCDPFSFTCDASCATCNGETDSDCMSCYDGYDYLNN